MLKLITMIIALCAAAAGIALITVKYMDIMLAPRYSYTRVKKLPDAFMPDFCGEDYV